MFDLFIIVLFAVAAFIGYYNKFSDSLFRLGKFVLVIILIILFKENIINYGINTLNTSIFPNAVKIPKMGYLIVNYIVMFILFIIIYVFLSLGFVRLKRDFEKKYSFDKNNKYLKILSLLFNLIVTHMIMATVAIFLALPMFEADNIRNSLYAKYVLDVDPIFRFQFQDIRKANDEWNNLTKSIIRGDFLLLNVDEALIFLDSCYEHGILMDKIKEETFRHLKDKLSETMKSEINKVEYNNMKAKATRLKLLPEFREIDFKKTSLYS